MTTRLKIVSKLPLLPVPSNDTVAALSRPITHHYGTRRNQQGPVGLTSRTAAMVLIQVFSDALLPQVTLKLRKTH